MRARADGDAAWLTIGPALRPPRSVSRGDGWHTLQHRHLSDETDARGDRLLIETHVLTRPGQPDVRVERVFERRGEELRWNAPAAQPPP